MIQGCCKGILTSLVHWAMTPTTSSMGFANAKVCTNSAIMLIRAKSSHNHCLILFFLEYIF
jgi:hypothetical protein